ncbi:hypothetical protein Taro_009874 [Colocasia esculenta]|uniref:Uncharacterized protein n=1 Tax=Colocasia esculenta TaxID=4460 RepID=A0A843TXG8_COLES|nr:hypothetical protein [Colocasia esculenta]
MVSPPDSPEQLSVRRSRVHLRPSFQRASFFSLVLMDVSGSPLRRPSVASKVDEMSVLLSQIQASQARTQPIPVPPPVQSESDSETDEAAYDYLDHDVHVS